MTDPDRLKRLHVVNVATGSSGAFYVKLSDGSAATWDAWCSGLRDDLRITTPDHPQPNQDHGGAL